ncbi:hypothetical protein BC628DRAFT_1339097 [Trametes gibbosa]|nr:hypothetical protein BC628DRAFT_1339097 [Trametes gibbosa]
MYAGDASTASFDVVAPVADIPSSIDVPETISGATGAANQPALDDGTFQPLHDASSVQAAAATHDTGAIIPTAPVHALQPAIGNTEDDEDGVEDPFVPRGSGGTHSNLSGGRKSPNHGKKEKIYVQQATATADQTPPPAQSSTLVSKATPQTTSGPQKTKNPSEQSSFVTPALRARGRPVPSPKSQ